MSDLISVDPFDMTLLHNIWKLLVHVLLLLQFVFGFYSLSLDQLD